MIDKLEKMFELQSDLMMRYVKEDYIPQFPLDLTKKESVAVIRDCIFHIESELHEAFKELKNRPNRKADTPEYDKSAYLKELMDVQHLLLELMLLSGLKPNELFRLYTEVNVSNHERLDKGY